MGKKKQLSMQFEPTIKPVETLTYAKLSIHEKINYRANSGGFAIIPYLSHYNYYHAPIIYRRKHDRLTRDYYDHYRLNAGGKNRLDRWRKENTNKQYKLI